jgi:chromosome segregation ATPase
VTVARLQDERAALDHRVAAQKVEKEKLNAAVTEARAQLQDTRTKLGAERESLDTLEKSIAEERASYVTLIEAKEQALRDATRSTRRIMEQLEGARRERRIAEDAKASVEKLLADLRKETEQRAKEREKLRRERDAARAERDTVQRERDAAIAEQEATERQLRRLQGELDRAASARSPRR